MLSESNQQKLKQAMNKHQFGHAEAYLHKTARQGVRLSKHILEDYKHAGGSRIGGDPDLTASTEWPLDSSGMPMTFLAQLHLQEVALHDEAHLLPADGMLYFFVGVDEPAYHIEHKVLYLPEEERHQVKRRCSPEVTSLEEVFIGYQADARASIELPNFGYADEEQIEDEKHDYEQYEELCFELAATNSNDLACMFGYPATQHGDCEVEASLRLLTGKPYNYSVKAAMEEITAHVNGDSDKAEQEVRDTLLLLALDSDREVGFLWWDAGELQFFIRKEDLLAGNFARTYCSLYSS